MTAAPAKKRKPPRRPVYFEVRRVIDKQTGEERLGLLAAYSADRDLMRQRKYRAGDLVRAELAKPRNSKFHRLVHALGTLIAEHIEGFEGMDAHAVIKRMQRETGLYCEDQDIEIPGFGRLVVKVAQSIAYDKMDDSDFKALWSGICRHICATYWPGMDQEAIDGMIGLMPEEVS